MSIPPKHLLMLSEAELEQHLKEWERHYLELTNYLSRRDEKRREVLDNLNRLLPVRKEIMRKLPEILGKFEKNCNTNLYCKTATTAFTGIFNTAALIGLLAGKDVSPSLFFTVNTGIGTADLAIEVCRYNEEKETLLSIREELKNEQGLKSAFCSSIKELEVIHRKIMTDFSKYNELTIVKVFRWHEMWSKLCGRSLPEKEKEAGEKIFSLGDRLSTLCSMTARASYHTQGGFITASGILALFLDSSSKGILGTLAAGNVLLSIIGGIKITREFRNGSEFLQCLRDDYSCLKNETDMLEKLKKELVNVFDAKQSIKVDEEKKGVEEASDAFKYLHSLAQKAKKDQK